MKNKIYRTPEIEITAICAADFLMNSGEVDIPTNPLFSVTESLWQE
ncbi:MAG: hypothetical protein ACI4RV_01995 [Eubacteriales bacterium]